MRLSFITFATIIALTSQPAYAFFGEKNKHDAGYKDGYAVGYNTACKIRATIIAADWGNSTYAEGFSEGVVDGIIECVGD